ncbi:MAG: hypothetical protein ACTSQY_02220 [Candidatus Odinarchaeia archaeon]
MSEFDEINSLIERFSGFKAIIAELENLIQKTIDSLWEWIDIENMVERWVSEIINWDGDLDKLNAHLDNWSKIFKIISAWEDERMETGIAYEHLDAQMNDKEKGYNRMWRDLERFFKKRDNKMARVIYAIDDFIDEKEETGISDTKLINDAKKMIEKIKKNFYR